jgi:hypothetical protein
VPSIRIALLVNAHVSDPDEMALLVVLRHSTRKAGSPSSSRGMNNGVTVGRTGAVCPPRDERSEQRDCHDGISHDALID